MKKQICSFRKVSLSIYSALILAALSFASPILSFSQTVPKEMTLGDLQLSITESTRRQIQKDVDRLTQSQTYFDILVDRMNLYFPIIEREHRRAGIPEKIKFLAIQESALISDAVSSANAVGFWQFKDFTAREVGLRVDRNVDERLNIVSASSGSAKYLNSNNFFLKNWIYSVMAYNTGRGGAQKYIDQSNIGAKKMTINSKTHWYVKKFIAHVVAFTPAVGRPHSKNIWLDEVRNAGGKSLQQIAREEKVDLEELKKYNKWLKRGTVPKDKTYSILVPRTGNRPKKQVAEKAPARQKQKIQTPKRKVYPSELTPGLSSSSRATVIPLNGIPSILARSNDDVHSISAKAGISEEKFRKFNDMSADDKIVPNEFYYIKKKKGKAKIGFHVAKPDESLWEISQQYGIKLSKLAKRNRMSIIDELAPGRVLWMDKTRPASEPIAYHEIQSAQISKPKKYNTIPEKPESPSKTEEVSANEEDVPEIIVPVVDTKEERLRKVKIHTVAQGESLWGISRLYEVSMDDLLRWNELPDPDSISIGQNIQVKAPIEEASKNKTIGQHTVQAGETVYAISRKYGMTVDEVMELNGLSSFALEIGQTLKVYEGD